MLFIRTGTTSRGKPIVYTVYVNHGSGGGGRRVGSKLNRLQDYATIIDADLYIVGHTHLPATFRQQVYRVCKPKHAAAPWDQVFVNTASALEYGGYGKRGGYQPASNCYPVITFDNMVHHISVTL